MPGMSPLDAAALAFFVVAWTAYHFAVKRGRPGEPGLNRRMDAWRAAWMRQMASRESRIVDASIMGSLQNGTAFFASTSLIALGAVATLLRAPDEALKLAAELGLGASIDRALFEGKTIGLLAIFGYAFFKFAWSYRLFNYAAILVGATPAASAPDAAERSSVAEAAARMNTVAGAHFSRGQRAFFFAIAYLGWYLGPFAFIATTALATIAMWNRQFHSDALAALTKA